MSYPPPPGPQGPPPQNQPGQSPSGQYPGGQNPGWQQPTQPPPQGGNWAAPPYGTPPPKNRAGLIIFLIVVLVALIIGVIGFVAYRLTSGSSNDGGTAPAGPLTSTQATTAPKPAPSKVVPSKPAPTQIAPSKPVVSKPAAGTPKAALALAGQFAGQLNGGHTDAAVAMTCADTKPAMPSLISFWIGGTTKLTVNEPVIGQDPYLVPFTGSTKGHKVSGMIIVQGSCITAFQLSQS